MTAGWSCQVQITGQQEPEFQCRTNNLFFVVLFVYTKQYYTKNWNFLNV